MAKSKKSAAGTGPKPWERTAAAASVRVGVRAPLQSFLIICEGAETERNYFESFRASKKVEDFRVEGLGDNTLSLVQRAVEIRDKYQNEREGAFDQIWCVFDRDSFPADRFNRAIQLAESQGFRVAYSNEAFEIWYLLHFDFHSAAISRTQYQKKLSKCLGFKYAKNSRQIYAALAIHGNEQQAIKFAEKLLREGSGNPAHDNPSTTVHRLVTELRRNARVSG